MSEHYEEFLRPRLRLFLSADIVGSTAHKQNIVLLTEEYVKRNQAEQQLLKKFEILAPPWLSPITKFYREIDRIFSQVWTSYCETTSTKIGWPVGPRPDLWKAVGDEIIYTKVLGDHREAFACVRLWCDTVRAYRCILQKEFPTLDIKATGWLAGFPISNSEIIIRNQVGSVDPFDTGDDVFYNFWLLEEYYSEDETKARGLTIDFVGPSVDTGFRLCTLSTPRKFVVSVDLALLLVSVTQPLRDFVPIIIRYDGRKELRGVLGGRPYPILWVDLLNDDEVLSAEDKLHDPAPICEKEPVRHFCEKFLEENEQYMIRPFIYGNSDQNFGNIPPIYKDRLRKLSDGWQAAKSHKEIEIKAIAGEEGPPSDGVPVGDEESVTSFQVPQTAPSVQDPEGQLRAPESAVRLGDPAT